jgi:hypothetical protein
MRSPGRFSTRIDTFNVLTLFYGRGEVKRKRGAVWGAARKGSFKEKTMTVQLITTIWEDDLRLFPLEGLLPAGQALSVNTTYLIVSLVSTFSVSSNPILLERPVTETNMRLLLPLLESPNGCPCDILRSSLFCSYKGLLAGLFSFESAAQIEWQTTVAEQRLLLQQAQKQGTWKRELKPLYNALSDTRPKLHSFGLEIAISASCSTYALMALPRLRCGRKPAHPVPGDCV